MPDRHDLPELLPGEYLPELMFKVGPMRAYGEASVATDWPVLVAFAENQGLDANDTEILAEMCKGFVRAMRDGQNPLAIPPVDQMETRVGFAREVG